MWGLMLPKKKKTKTPKQNKSVNWLSCKALQRF